MNQIILKIDLFCFKQSIQLFQNGECVESLELPVDEIMVKVGVFCNQYNIDRIVFLNQNYISERLKNNLEHYLQKDHPQIRIEFYKG